MQRYSTYTFSQLDSRYMLMFLSNISLELHYSHFCLEFNAKRTGYGVLEFYIFACLPLKNCFAQSEKFFKMKARSTELTSHSVIWLIATLQNCHKKLATKNQINSS